jgi:hypothetical protein
VDTLEDDLSTVGGLVELVKRVVGAQQPGSQVALQQLKLDKPTAAERELLKYSALGHAVVELAGTVSIRLTKAMLLVQRRLLRSTSTVHARPVLRVLQALSSMPFGAPLAAAMGALFKQSVKVRVTIKPAAMLISCPASCLSHSRVVPKIYTTGSQGYWSCPEAAGQGAEV